jgi:L-2,4-diaminobutyrate transaminase
MNSSIADADKRHFLHPFTSIQDHQDAGSQCIVSAKGIRVTDSEGREYIDAMAGLWCVNIGYGREEMAEAIAAQSRKLSYYHTFMQVTNEPASQLSARIASLTPGDLDHVFFCNSGSEANDTQVKIAWYYNNLRGKPGKKKFISRRGGYHGVTVASASLSGLPHLHNRFDVPRSGFFHVTRPSFYWEGEAGETESQFVARLAAELEQTIEREGADTIAAFFAEPIMGAGGVIVPPAGYFEAIVPILRKNDILFVADEVVCGFGRLGTWFGSDYYGIQPDLMTVAKGLTSGYLPMSACVVSGAVYDVLLSHSREAGPFGHGYTYSAHPVAAAAGLCNLDIIERENLVQNAAEVGAYLQERLESEVAPHPLVGEKRGTGLIAAIELVKDREKKEAFPLETAASKRMYRHLAAQGLICRPVVNCLTFSPPLIVTRADVDEIVAKFSAALAETADELVREGLWNGA